MKKFDLIVVPQQTAPTISGIIFRRLDELTPWPGNPRKRSKRQIVALANSIRTYGAINPIIIDEYGVMLSGHGRHAAGQFLDLETFPTRVITGLTEAQKCAFVIADNKISELSGWDEPLLKTQLEIIINSNLSIEHTGFSTAETDVIFQDPQESKGTDPGDLQETDIAVEVVSRRDDLWICGSHRLFCGDALDPNSYDVVLRGDRAQMIFSDPPYNLAISGIGGKGKIKHPEFAMASGEMSRQGFTDFLHRVLSQTQAFSVDGAIHYYCMDWRHMREMLDAAEPLFGPLRQLCVWSKDNGGMGTFYRSQHELVFVFKNGSAPHINNFELGQHGRYRTNVWSYPGVNTFAGNGFEQLAMHPTVKPVSLVADAIRDCSHRKGLILDPFAGSGTALISCERTGRYARAIELDPRYVDVGVLRWQRVTGVAATLAATGQTWEQVRTVRLPQSSKEARHGV